MSEEVPGTDEPLLRLSPKQREEVRSALRRGDLSPRLRERLEMVKAADLGHGLDEIAAWSGREPRTVRRWLGAFANGGTGALADAPRSGRPIVSDAAYLGALEKAAEAPPRELGLGFDVWTSERLSAYLERTRGIRIASGWLRALLGRVRHAPVQLLQPRRIPTDGGRNHPLGFRDHLALLSSPCRKGNAKSA